MSNFQKNFETEIVSYDNGDVIKNIVNELKEIKTALNAPVLPLLLVTFTNNNVKIISLEGTYKVNIIPISQTADIYLSASIDGINFNDYFVTDASDVNTPNNAILVGSTGAMPYNQTQKITHLQLYPDAGISGSSFYIQRFD